MPHASIGDLYWEEKYQALQEFIAEYGRFPKFRESYKGINLGLWCCHQKYNMESPSFKPERKKKLEALGLPEKMQRASWEQYLEATLSFIEEQGRLPKESESHQGLKIGTWCYTNRYKATMPDYPPERRQKLEEAGIIGAPNMTYKETRWEHQFQTLKAFYEEYGRMPTQAETYNGENIGTWLMSQKKFINSYNYPPDRFEKMQALDLPRKERKEEWQQRWDNILQLVIQFREENGRWPKDHECYQGVNIGNWYFKNRQAAKKRTYPPDRYLKLKLAGVLDSKIQQKEQKWEENFQALQSFVQEHNRLPISGEKHMGVNVGYWCIAERRNAANLPNYPEEKLQRLISLGLCCRQKKNPK